MKPVIRNLKNADRRGTVIMMVLVCLVVVTSLILASVHFSLQQQRLFRTEMQLEQTEWLLDAGIRRAIVQVKQQPNYDGETIQVAGELKNADRAAVNISLVRKPDISRVQVTVEARLSSEREPNSATLRSRVFELPSQPRSP